MSGERPADELRAQAHREHEVLVQEARVKAREIVTEAETQRERLRAEVRRLERARTQMRVGYRLFLPAAPGAAPPPRLAAARAGGSLSGQAPEPARGLH